MWVPFRVVRACGWNIVENNESDSAGKYCALLHVDTLMRRGSSQILFLFRIRFIYPLATRT